MSKNYTKIVDKFMNVIKIDSSDITCNISDLGYSIGKDSNDIILVDIT